MKKLHRIIVLALTVIIALGIISAIEQKSFANMPCQFKMPMEFSLPKSRLVAVGMATHGNGDPFVATLSILKETYREYGGVALILEENVGDAEIVNAQYSYSDKFGQTTGFYLVYNNQEMSDILRWLEQTEQRLYGIDIQSVQAISDRLNYWLKEMGMSDAECAFSTTDKDDMKENLLLLDKIAASITEKGDSEMISERECCYLLHQIDCIRMNYEYQIKKRPVDLRDRFMAQNVQWAIEYEEKYYNNNHAVLLASNGHVVKTPWQYQNKNVGGKRMGGYLSDSLKQDYFVIVTEAVENYFVAGIGTAGTNRRIFHIIRRNFPILPIGANNAYLTNQDILNNEYEVWNLTMIGATFASKYALNENNYAVQVPVRDGFDAMILSRVMTCAHFQ